ncbi:MAG TPA: alanine racemase [Chloroflexota bacterium]|nr:alanine racemase [Chloroflexota bacterium]
MTTSEERAGSPGQERPCWLDVDLDAIGENVRSIARLVGSDTKICAVVKAEAYGLGAVEVSRAALAAGADRLAVARVDEALALRRAGIHAPILLIAGFVPSEAETIVHNRITATVVQARDGLALARAAGRLGEVVTVHVKVDTGLTRYGAPAAEVPSLVRMLRGLPTVRVEGLYSHFAAADEADATFTAEQLHRLFQVVEAVGRLDDDGWRPPIVHAANSAATLREPASWLHMVRVGIGLSGHYGAPDVPREVTLRPAVALRARLLAVKDVPAGTSIGYNRTFFADRQLRVGLVPAGYADGVPRSHSNRAVALVAGTRLPVVGRVSMDQCVVDLTENPWASPGNVVTLFGRDALGELTLEEYASWSDTIVHEALCRIGPRVPRRYLAGGRAWWGTVSESFASTLG